MKQRNMYSNISNFGALETSLNENPLTYVLGNTIEQRFIHGPSSYVVNGQFSKPSQAYFSDYCAIGWDGMCELGSKNQNISFPNNLDLSPNDNSVAERQLTQGDVLIKNTAAKKYLIAMANCTQKFEPFDPTVASSPMISYWIPNENSSGCIPMYAVDPLTIDNDTVMNKILGKPYIAIDILVNIYNTMKRKGTLEQLNGTKLGKFFSDNNYFSDKLYL